MKTAVAISHVSFEDLGWLAPFLGDKGFDVTYLDAVSDHLEPALDADLLVVLGGPIGVNDRDDFAFIETEIELLSTRIERGRPTVGFCLGSQLIAAALGARVYKGRQVEVGWAPVTLTAEGAALLAELDSVPVMHWHGDTFDLPEGAVLLASTAITPHQAFAYGDHCLALQFHPEVTALGLERWFVGYVGDVAATAGMSVPALRAASAANAPGVEAAGRAVFSRWLAGAGL